MVDVMSTKAVGWAPANPWFANGFDLRETVAIDDVKIQIMPLLYFLASKFLAFKDRGRTNPRLNKGLEDITYILDNRTDWHESLVKAPHDV